MKMFALCFLIFAFVGNVYAAKPPRCENVPVTVTFEDPITVPASMWNDIPGTPYVNAVIHYNLFCDGSRDMTFGTDPGRFLWMQLPSEAAGSIIDGPPPSFAGGAAFMTQAFINVRNITARNTALVIPGPNPATFYTKVSVSSIQGPDGNGYALSMLPDAITCPLGEVCAPNFTSGPTLPTKNDPEQTAWAKVTYTPSPDTWVVEGEFDTSGVTQRATLFLVPGSNGESIHSGQYSMPFRMVITAQTSLPVTPEIFINDVSVTEGDKQSKNVTFTVSLSAAITNAVSVDYATANGTAIAPDDYTAKTGTVSIPAGSTSNTFTVSVKGEKVAETVETFFVNLSNPLNGTIVDSQGVGTIVDND